LPVAAVPELPNLRTVGVVKGAPFTVNTDNTVFASLIEIRDTAREKSNRQF
jgi:hypothetical protein